MRRAKVTWGREVLEFVVTNFMACFEEASCKGSKWEPYSRESKKVREVEAFDKLVHRDCLILCAAGWVRGAGRRQILLPL